ncbi:hypothetical protein DW917_12440 [Prevotella sp. AM42-24]|nr:hypothetical protein DW917_12440 [Prevotella sp. AM42-24]
MRCHKPLIIGKIKKNILYFQTFRHKPWKNVENISRKAMDFRIKILSLQRVKVGKVAEFARNMVGKAP